MSVPEDRTAAPPSRPLDGVLVVALEQAVAAPYCSSRLADAGARVIKIERPEGDFARGYDRAVHGEASYWVWINRGKESIALNRCPNLLGAWSDEQLYFGLKAVSACLTSN